MLFNLNKGTNLTTFWSDIAFTAHIGKLLKIPPEHYTNWQEHYISLEFNSPANLEENVTVRIYTSQASDRKLVLTRDVGDIVTVNPTKYQNVTVGYEVETNGYTLNQLRGDLEAEVIKTRITSTVIQNINNLQQKHILENKDFKINFTKLIKREEKIDKDVFPKGPEVIPNTAEVFNNKFTKQTRQILEKEIRDYNNSTFTHPRNTYDFYQGVSIGLKPSIKDPSLPGFYRQKCQNLDFQTQQIAHQIKKYYNL